MIRLIAILFLTAPFAIIAQELNPESKTHAIKFELFTPLNNLSVITYEQYLKPFRSMEAGIGLIGLGNDGSDEFYGIKAQGLFFKIACKTILRKGLNKKGDRLGGTYLKYEIGYARFEETVYWVDLLSIYHPPHKLYTYVENIHAFSMMFIAGQQFVFKKRVLLNVYAGVGPVFDNRDYDKRPYFYYNRRENDYLARRYFEGNRLATTMGMSLGFLF